MPETLDMRRVSGSGLVFSANLSAATSFSATKHIGVSFGILRSLSKTLRETADVPRRRGGARGGGSPPRVGSNPPRPLAGQGPRRAERGLFRPGEGGKVTGCGRSKKSSRGLFDRPQWRSPISETAAQFVREMLARGRPGGSRQSIWRLARNCRAPRGVRPGKRMSHWMARRRSSSVAMGRPRWAAIRSTRSKNSALVRAR